MLSKSKVNLSILSQALEYTQTGLMVPSLVIDEDRSKNLEAVYLGGLKAAINEEFIKCHNITHILNVAGKGLGLFFGPKYRVCIETIYCLIFGTCIC